MTLKARAWHLRAFVLLAGIAVLSACSGGGSPRTATPTTPPTTAPSSPNPVQPSFTPATPAAATATPAIPYEKQKVTYKSNDGFTLTGFLYKPSGSGPFPLIVWNHGSGESQPASGPPLFATAARMESDSDGVAEVLVRAGFAVMAPERRGQGESQGPYIQDVLAQRKQGSPVGPLFVAQMEGPQLADQLAGLTFAESEPFVDKSRLVVMGCSYGGIQTLLGAESGAYRVAVAISPAAESWDGDKPLQDRLRKAADTIQIPMMVIHPAADVSLEPGKVLGAEFDRLKKPFELKIYPLSGDPTADGHCFGSDGRGARIWGADAVRFITGVIGPVH